MEDRMATADKSPQIRLIGYSERGMINAICEDILRGGLPTLKHLIGQLTFVPSGGPSISDVQKAEILVEHGFSTFGDLDLLILIEHRRDGENQRTALLIEAKVAAEKPGCLARQCEGFKRYLQNDKRDRSNLFVQLYRKMVLVRQCQYLKELIPGNVVFPVWSLGSKEVIEKAAKKLADYCGDAWFIAILPDQHLTVDSFYRNEFPHFVTSEQRSSLLPEWNTRQCGFLCWPQFITEAAEAEMNGDDMWRRTLDVWKWNKDQIFIDEPDAGGQLIRKDCWYRHLNPEGERLLVVVNGRNSSRVVRDNPVLGVTFRDSFKVPNNELVGEPTLATLHQLGSLLPKRGETYSVTTQAGVIQVKVLATGGWTKLWLVKRIGSDEEIEIMPQRLTKIETTTSNAG